ncbi:carbohydrate-binding protein [Actinoplanes sp. DH11]|uniref:carbohydrate-binding protein n=1 Tax=Actinoplanes sp. DH11 TaxID=2857011 RepID=UPI001E2EA9E6|nr:carbohydrate-binding protein [Actinoplanes sp. DH11]
MNGARLLRSLVAAAVLVSGLTALSLSRPGSTAAAAAAPAAAAAAAAAPTVTRTVFSDGFAGDRGTAPDAAKWAPARRAWLDGEGHLVLDEPLRTAAAVTRKSGRAEASIRMRRTSGAWRALAVLDESGRLPAGKVETFPDDGVDDDEFHTYAIDWTPTSMVWSVDGVRVLRFTPEESGRPFFLALNPAAGWRSETVVVDSVRITVQVAVTATPWKKFTDYRAGRYVSHQGSTYRVRERHTSLPGWQPAKVPALFEKI